MITTLEQAIDFIKNLKRSDKWVSDIQLFERLKLCESLILKHHREDAMPYIGINFCLYYIDIGDYKNAWQYIETAKKYAEQYNNIDCLLSSLSLQYRIQRYWGNLEVAQEIIGEQIEIAYQYNDPLHLASSYHNQGALFHRQRLKSSAKEAYLKSIEFILKSNNQYYISSYYIGYAGVLIDFNEVEEAEIYLKKGFEIAQSNNFLQALAIAYSNYGLIYQNLKDEEKCFEAYENCSRLFEELKNTSNAIMTKIMLADAYVSFNRIDEAEKLLNETILFSEQNNLKYNQIGIFEALSNLMEKKEDFKNALKYHKKLISIKEEYLNAESEKRIHTLEQNQTVNILRIEKQNAEKMANLKHDFLANMSHEIRTPINSILGICYLLQQQALNNIQLDYVNRLKRSGENLLGIVNDVLDISKIEAGKMEFVHEPFLLKTLLQDIFQSLEPKTNDKGIDFRVTANFENDLSLVSDPVRLYQVLLNLTSNAIKFTTEGFVTVDANVVQKQGNNVEAIFIIQDSGIGIAQEKLDRIFERYEQANASIKNIFGGTGLGLSISKKIVELMHGNIQVKSELNVGTVFTVIIPFATTQTEVISKVDLSNLPKELADNMSILIADDNLDNRLVVKEILQNFNPNITIIEVENGQEVLQQLEHHSFDVILMDFDMPIIDGITATQQIRTSKAFQSIRIIGNTASLIALSDDEIKSLGFNDFITKPFKPEELIKKVLNQ